MDHDKMMDLLVQIVSDMSYVKTKLENIDDQKIINRIDALESQNSESTKTIKDLEDEVKRINEYMFSNLDNTKRYQTTVFVSLGLAIFSAILSSIFTLL